MQSTFRGANGGLIIAVIAIVLATVACGGKAIAPEGTLSEKQAEVVTNNFFLTFFL